VRGGKEDIVPSNGPDEPSGFPGWTEAGFENITVVAIKGQVSCDLRDEAVILHVDDGVYYGLNSVGARVWKMVQEPTTAGKIRDDLLAEYEVERSRCERELITLLQEMSDRGLIEMTRGSNP
jgi:hypothetical protein